MIRSPRTPVGLSLAALLAALITVATPGGASADPSVIWRPGTTPTGAGFWSNTCPTDKEPQVRTALSADDDGYQAAATPARGESSGDVAWSLPTTATTQGGPSVAVSGAAITTLSGLAIDVSGPASGRLFAYYTSDDDKTLYYGTADVADTTAGWHTLDVSGALTWYVSGLFGWTQQRFIGDWHDTYSIPTFVKDAKLTSGTLLLGYEFGCTSDPLSIDHLAVTTTSGTTDYNFATLTSSTGLTADTTAITGTGSVTLTSSVTDSNSAPVTAGRVRVMAEQAGEDTFSLATTIGPQGSVTLDPTTSTTYRLDYTGSVAAEASRSDPLSVTVQPTIAAKAKKGTVHRGKAIRLSGSTAPTRAGVPVVIQRKTGSTWRQVAKTTTSATGSYSAPITATGAGRWRLRARLAADGGNPSALSPTVAVAVNIVTSVTAKLTPSTVVTGTRYVVSGRAHHAKKRTVVKLQQRVSGRWIQIARSHVGAGGRYRFHPWASALGHSKLRVVLAASGWHLKAISPKVRLKVKAAPVVSPPTGSGGGHGGGGGQGGGVGHG